MLQNAFAYQKRYSKNLKKVIPVVAQDYVINDSSYVEPVGITELIEATNNFLPEGKKQQMMIITIIRLNVRKLWHRELSGLPQLPAAS